MGKRAAQLSQPVRLADQIGMQRDAHDLGLAIADLPPPFLEIIDQELGESLRAVLARDDGGDVVGFLWIGHTISGPARVRSQIGASSAHQLSV